MTRTEVAAILHRLAAAYRAEITKAEAEVWADHLEKFDFGIAVTATDNLIREADGFFPTIARFRETYRAEAKRLDGQAPALPAAWPPKVDPSKLRDMLDQARAALFRGSGE